MLILSVEDESGTATWGGGPRPISLVAMSPMAISKAASLNHIGIAVSDLNAMKRLFAILGLSVDHVEAVPEQGVVTHFLPLPLEQGNLEFLEPTDPEGTISKYLQKKGPGIHHLSFKVKTGELDSLSDRLRGEGYRLIYDASRMGAHGMRVNFIHPASAGGILVEIMEKADG